MKAGGGKQKGSSFERQICKQLSLWISNGERDNLFWRSAMSGGRATVRAKKGERTDNQAGDISAIDPMGHVLTDNFVVECKSYKSLEWESFIYGEGFVWKTWGKLIKDSSDNGRLPFLILKQNRKPVLVALPYKVINRLDKVYLHPLVEARSQLGLYLLEELIDEADFQTLIKD